MNSRKSLTGLQIENHVTRWRVITVRKCLLNKDTLIGDILSLQMCMKLDRKPKNEFEVQSFACMLRIKQKLPFIEFIDQKLRILALKFPHRENTD